MNRKSVCYLLFVILFFPIIGGITFAESGSSASASASSDGPVRATIGTFLFTSGSALAVEIGRDAPCPCMCDPLLVTGLRLLNGSGDTIPYVDETSPFPVAHDEWVGRLNLTDPSGAPLAEGEYTVVVDTTMGEFRARLQVISPEEGTGALRVSSHASVCGAQLMIYRLFDATEGEHAIDLNVGDLLVFALHGNPTTGYRWQLVDALDNGILEEIDGIDYLPDPIDPAMVGGGGTFFFRYTAVSSGTQTLRFDYQRPWETEEPEQTVSFVVTVH